MGLTVLAAGFVPRDPKAVLVGLPALILVLGLIAFTARLAPALRARSRSRAAEMRMAGRLKTSVRRENARHAVADLRVRREEKVQPGLTETERVELLQRIERLRVRGGELSSDSRGASAPDGQRQRLQGRAAGGDASNAPDPTPELRFRAPSPIPPMVFPFSSMLESGGD